MYTFTFVSKCDQTYGKKFDKREEKVELHSTHASQREETDGVMNDARQHQQLRGATVNYVTCATIATIACE